ncbi:unnamed protein product, partial [Durusdinium trenchii]
GFDLVAENEWLCQPASEDYEGPCQGPVTFDNFNVDMLEEWSLRCQARWPCLGVTSADIERELDAVAAPLSFLASARRVAAT